MGHADPAGAVCLRLDPTYRDPGRPHRSRRARTVAGARRRLSRLARNGWQETLGVHMTSGTPEQLIVLSRATYLPLYTALATAAAVLAMLFQFYLLALAAALVTAALFVLAGQSA